LITRERLEAEQRDFIGRDRYERGERKGYRNRSDPGHMDTAKGRVRVLPQVRGAETAYRSRLFDFLRGDSVALERLAMDMYARGLSPRDVQDEFTDENPVCSRVRG
jgi:transposase-like protein